MKNTIWDYPRIRSWEADIHKEEVSRKMQDTAGETPALPYEEAARSSSVFT